MHSAIINGIYRNWTQILFFCNNLGFLETIKQYFDQYSYSDKLSFNKFLFLYYYTAFSLLMKHTRVTRLGRVILIARHECSFLNSVGSSARIVQSTHVYATTFLGIILIKIELREVVERRKNSNRAQWKFMLSQRVRNIVLVSPQQRLETT